MSGYCRKIIDRVFSDQYIHLNVNIVQLVMYRGAYPCALMLSRLGLSPNQITTASLISAVIAFYTLAFLDGWIWFSVFWGLSVLLDFSDGTVARMTDRVSKMAFRYDHMSDLFKVSLIILGVGIRYNDPLIWILSVSACFAFMYGDALNRELGIANSRQVEGGMKSTRKPGVRRRDRYRLIGWVFKYEFLYKIYKSIISVLLTVNGHTLLLFFIFVHGPVLAIWGLSYLILVELLVIKSRISKLVVMRR